MKIEYKVLNASLFTSDQLHKAGQLEAALNEAAKQGFRVVTVLQAPSGGHLAQIIMEKDDLALLGRREVPFVPDATVKSPTNGGQ